MWNFYFTRGSIFCDRLERFCDRFDAKIIFRDKCGNFAPNRYRNLGLNPLQNSLLLILSILEKNLLWILVFAEN